MLSFRNARARHAHVEATLNHPGDGDVEFEEFYRVHCKLSSLMFPAFRLRRILRIKCMGNRFWRRCEKNREKIQKATGAAPASPRETRAARPREPPL